MLSQLSIFALQSLQLDRTLVWPQQQLQLQQRPAAYRHLWIRWISISKTSREAREQNDWKLVSPRRKLKCHALKECRFCTETRLLFQKVWLSKACFPTKPICLRAKLCCYFLYLVCEYARNGAGLRLLQKQSKP